MMSSPADEHRTGFIALIGTPNVGKSTLMNRMIGQKVAITSCRPQTTRNRILTVVTDERSQMIFLDTPGIHEARNRLGEKMVSIAREVRNDADVVLWLLDAKREPGDDEQRIGEELERLRAPVVIVLNKADTVSEDTLKRNIETMRTKYSFAEVCAVSALKGDNTDELKRMITERLPYGPPLYDEDELTDMPEREIAAEMVREKALRLLKDEVPHGLAVVTESMKERTKKDGTPVMDVHATIVCEKDTHKGIVIGKNGAMLKKIGAEARTDMEKMLDMQVNLQLFVKVRKNWRDDPLQLKSLGLWKD